MLCLRSTKTEVQTLLYAQTTTFKNSGSLLQCGSKQNTSDSDSIRQWLESTVLTAFAKPWYSLLDCSCAYQMHYDHWIIIHSTSSGWRRRTTGDRSKERTSLDGMPILRKEDSLWRKLCRLRRTGRFFVIILTNTWLLTERAENSFVPTMVKHLCPVHMLLER